MEITWYGLSCFRLTERGKASVVVDPYNHAVVGYSPLKLRADVVAVSHDAPGHSFLPAVKPIGRVIDGPGEYEVGEVFITGVATSSKKKNSNGVRNVLYVFDFDGGTVAHLGDLSRVLTQAEVEALGTVNIACVPVGGGSSLNAAKAAEVISMLEPGIVIPMHYHTKGSKLDLAPLDKFMKEMGLGEIPVEPVLKVTASTVPEDTRVVVLEAVQK